MTLRRGIIALIVITLVGSALFFITKRDTVHLTEKKAVAKVKALPAVVEYLKRVPEGRIEVNGEEESEFHVQVYEMKDNHTATFNWYSVDKTTGEVKELFP
ncbi:MAG: hypothetical protein HYW85_04625 [Deltaproteobacteria bacterium]|nr:hypothetical protein [Deltaproteobacteria bacterium]MBI3016714.1 hypothetical protein [Deltaproteobacteria bacterium]